MTQQFITKDILVSKNEILAEIERRLEKISNASSENNRELSAIYGAQIYELINLAQYINTLEVKEVDLEKKKEVIVKGFVAVDNGGDKMTWNPTGRRVAFFPKKPVRDLLTDSHYWAAHISPYDVIHLNHDAFPELKWEDEPIEVELIIKA